MSLKTFHLCFITLSMALMTYILVWAGRKAAAGSAAWGTGAAALLSLVLGLAYLRWFLKEYKKLK